MFDQFFNKLFARKNLIVLETVRQNDVGLAGFQIQVVVDDLVLGRFTHDFPRQEAGLISNAQVTETSVQIILLSQDGAQNFRFWSRIKRLLNYETLAFLLGVVYVSLMFLPAFFPLELHRANLARHLSHWRLKFITGTDTHRRNMLKVIVRS